MSSTMENYPELLAELASLIGDRLVAAGLDHEFAADVGLQSAEHVRKNYSGQLLYLPKGRKHDEDIRNRQIYSECNGANHSELAARYDLSVVRIYQIIKMVHAEDVRRRQPDMFRKKESNQ